MKKDNFDLFEVFESFGFMIFFVLIASVGGIIKFIFLNIFSLITFNKIIKLKKLWKKENIEKYALNPWNFALTLFSCFILFKYI
ncbi:hypothetical protein [Mesoflavibacter sp. SCSIO 43206]|jgi:hypothetical protein|uniref:hypothetical protein n=1 Tax=Mesoflavibacter sp. SCSIO 43206 TaxID=2779362 RepID=UPI001CA9EE08|nr:hypothetical protein [Mesoflavibacter sp. SCSIO 43206]UAB75473.1 hypothetical protein INR78_00355 [Mesoflavibacter sp. SCSIO 43206]